MSGDGSKTVSDTSSQAARLVHRLFLFEEEHLPLVDDPSLAILVTRVSEHLSVAAGAIESNEPLDVAVELLWATCFALTAVARINPERDEAGLSVRKDRLLVDLDEDVLDSLETSVKYLRASSLDQLVRAPLCALTDAYQCITALEGMNTLCEDEDVDREKLLELIADSLSEAAVKAATAAEVLSQRREAAVGRRR